MGIQGTILCKPHKTTIRIKPLHVRWTTSTGNSVRPRRTLWVSDFTYVATWAGFVYVAFVIDA